MGMCYETYPVSCQAQLVDLTEDDYCEALIHEVVSIPLSKVGLTGKYFERAEISIQGQDGGKAMIQLK